MQLRILKINLEGETFEPAKNCKPCPVFGVEYKDNKWRNIIEKKCNENTFRNTDDIKKEGKFTEKLDMLVSDNIENKSEKDLEACKTSGIFKGIRKEQWECGNFCGYVVCKSEKGNGQNDGTYIIQIRALLKRWLETFFEDYNKINDKISHCMKKGEGSKCKYNCQNKCNCVVQWISEKRKEWQQIRKRYLEQYKNSDSDHYNVKFFLQQKPFYNEVNKAIKPCNGLDKFQDSSYCTVNGSSENGVTNKKDIVDCLIDKLENLKNKTESCLSSTSGETCNDTLPQTLEDETLDDDIETEEVKAPNICPETKEPPEEQTHEKCEEAASPDSTVPEVQEEENADKKSGSEASDTLPGPAGPKPKPEPEEELPSAPELPEEKAPVKPAPKKPPPPARRTPELLDDPLKTALVTSTLAWSVGIGFAAFTYFYLK
ncbi:hypothetical protein PFTANZ_06621, partial [Plasmodium falciparum Tanzania (2000708)]